MALSVGALLALAMHPVAAVRGIAMVSAALNVSSARSVPRFGFNTVGTMMSYNDGSLAAAAGSELGHGLLGRYPGGTVSDFWLWRQGWVNVSQPGWGHLGAPLNNTPAAFSSFVERAGWAEAQLFCLNAIQASAETQVSMLEHAVVVGRGRSTVGFIELGNEFFAGDRTLDEPQTYPTPADYASAMVRWMKLIRQSSTPALQTAPFALVAAPHNFSTDRKPNPYAEAWNRQVFGSQAAIALASAGTVHVYQSLPSNVSSISQVGGLFVSVFARVAMQRAWATATIPSQLELWITEYGGGVKPPDSVSGSWMAALYQLLFAMLLPADERVTVMLSHALTWNRLDDAAIANTSTGGSWQATLKGSAMAVLYKAAASSAGAKTATEGKMMSLVFTPNPRLSTRHPHADAISAELLGWAFASDSGGRLHVHDAVILNLSPVDRPAMDVSGLFTTATSGSGGSGGGGGGGEGDDADDADVGGTTFTCTAYDVADGELLTVGARLRKTTRRSAMATVAVPAFSVVSVSV